MDYLLCLRLFLGFAGSFTGINEKGVCFDNMLVYNGYNKRTSTEGLPIQLLMQEAAECSESVEDMQKIASYKHMIPNSVTCADEQEAIILEVDQKNSAVRKSNNQVIYGTNYFVTDIMAKKHRTGKRFNVLDTTAKKKYGVITQENLKSIMHKARKPQGNLQCVIFKPSERLMLVSMNKVPATVGPFKEYNIDELFCK